MTRVLLSFVFAAVAAVAIRGMAPAPLPASNCDIDLRSSKLALARIEKHLDPSDTTEGVGFQYRIA
jgi:hypothetical protein